MMPSGRREVSRTFSNAKKMIEDNGLKIKVLERFFFVVHRSEHNFLSESDPKSERA